MPETSSLRTATLRSDLQACGVSIIDCPHNGRKDTADKMMMGESEHNGKLVFSAFYCSLVDVMELLMSSFLVDMLAFATDNSAPAIVLLISGDGDFLYAVSTLRLRKYDIVLLAPAQCSHLGLKAQSTAVYDWPRDVLCVELPVPSYAVLTGSVMMTPVTTLTQDLSSVGRQSIPTFTDFSRTGPSYASATINSRAVSQPNTPQAITTPTRLPSTRPRASSASLQQHSRSTSMPVAPQIVAPTAYSLSMTRLQAAQGVVSGAVQPQGRTVCAAV